MSESNTTTKPASPQAAAEASEVDTLAKTPAVAREFVVEPRYTTRQVDEHTWELGIVLPGVKRDDIHVSLEDNELEIAAPRHSLVPKDWRAVHLTRPAPTGYRLQLTLGLDVDPDRISAKLEDGILTLRLPVAEAARPRRISVK